MLALPGTNVSARALDGRETAVLMAGSVDIIRNFSGLSGTGRGRNRRRRTAI